jgi:hypothetical protein
VRIVPMVDLALVLATLVLFGLSMAFVRALDGL